MTLETNKPHKSMILVYLQCYFVTIATILGTGILGLPVTLTHAGLYPFLISFILGSIIQGLLIFFFTDLLQRAYALQLKSCREDPYPIGEETEFLMDEDIDDLQDEASGPVLAGHVIIPKDINIQPPNLHLLGNQFLPCGLRQFFDIILVLQFMALLISYALAGSEAYGALIGIDYRFIIPVFVWVLTLAIVFALKFIQPIVSVLTFFKGSLLLGTVIVTFYVGASVHREIINDYSYFGAPFLMGTVALGGVVNVMPMLYSKIQPLKNQIQNFRFAIVLGLFTCAILNIGWSWAVLDIVPQLEKYTCEGGNTTTCYNDVSLESAAKHGEISTIPLTTVISRTYPTFEWVAILVELFIVVSITVSYLTIGAVLHHTLNGWVNSFWAKDSMSTYRDKLKTPSKCSWCNSQCMCNSVLSLVTFGIVFLIAMMDPQGFLDMLEKFASFTINLEVALFVFLMLLKSRNSENRRLKIPLPLPPVVYYLVYIIPVYFGFAVGYDVYNTIRDIIVEQSGTSQGKIITQGITGVAKNITKSFNVTSSVMSSTLPMTSSNVTVSSLLENVTSSTLVQHLVSTVKDFTGGGR
ncbi:uncharacterized protein LOC128220506 isoform X2 [Mya arenaria]|uniref:uncharacterized protein LOC128220506 isoform X2 n=1 Tax=Mya arenaria TaxID=6604 RepID=UPI0022E85420|nr:uncharacterized protein LOC128220506 isoform X2 [Mya arenaria]